MGLGWWVELDIVELDGGTTPIVSDKTVVVHRSVDDFWAEARDGEEGHRTVTRLRETEQPFKLAGAR